MSLFAIAARLSESGVCAWLVDLSCEGRATINESRSGSNARLKGQRQDTGLGESGDFAG